MSLADNRFPAWVHWPLPAEATSLRAFQGERCAWCGFEDNLVRDHCHMTGLVRGLLCRACDRVEGNGETGPWDGWRAGHNPAAALGLYEIYRNHMSVTPISNYAVLSYYSADERKAWQDQTVADLLAGKTAWPTDAPWTEAARARRDEEDRQAAEALARFNDFFTAPRGGAA